MPWTQRAVLGATVGLCIWYCWNIHRELERKSHFILAEDVRKHLGEEKGVSGKVLGIKHLRDGKVSVDFGAVYAKQNSNAVFTVVFTPEAYGDVCEEHGGFEISNFVIVRGTIDFYASRAHMTITTAEDVITPSDADSDAAWAEHPDSDYSFP